MFKEALLVSLFVMLQLSLSLPLILQSMYYISSLKSEKENKFKSNRLPRLSVIVPIRNEKPELIMRLLKSIANADYDLGRLEVIIVSDDPRNQFLKIKNRIYDLKNSLPYEISIFHRERPQGFKAGALNYALKYVKGEIIVVFDADTIVPKNFFIKAINKMIGENFDALMVKWSPLNPKETLLSEAIGQMQLFSFKTLFEGRFNTFGYCCIAGSGFLIRKIVLEEMGGFNEKCLLEDVDLGLRLFLKKYKIGYQPSNYVMLEVPSTYIAYRGQQERWAYGAIQLIKKYLIKILASKRNFTSRIEYILYLSQYASSIFLLIYTLLAFSMLYLSTVKYALQLFLPSLLLWFIITMFYSTTFIDYCMAKGKLSFFKSLRILGRTTGLTYFMLIRLILSILKAVVGKSFYWHVTPKGNILEKKRKTDVSEIICEITYSALMFTLMSISFLKSGFNAITFWMILQSLPSIYSIHMILSGKV